MGNAGMLGPFMAAWTENILYVVVGALLLWRVDRR
jgi:lipopolysaccharide export LptBFGC system permease protein LptF